MTYLFRRVRLAAIYGILIVLSLLFAPIVLSRQRHRRQGKSRSKSVMTRETNTGWYTFKGPDNDFTIDFPAEPKRIEDVPGPVTVIRRYALATDRIYFEISIQDSGGEPGSAYANEFSPKFEENMAREMGEDGAKIVQLRRTTKGSYQMELWVPASTRGHYFHGLRRGVIRNGRQYNYGCNSLVADKEVNRDVCRRFFNSFRITGLPR
jgi:hypothetical protein